ncbi:hypothetical protein VUR80DRAFT_4863 [Thermomyces stellatus]
MGSEKWIDSSGFHNIPSLIPGSSLFIATKTKAGPPCCVYSSTLAPRSHVKRLWLGRETAVDRDAWSPITPRLVGSRAGGCPPVRLLSVLARSEGGESVPKSARRGERPRLRLAAADVQSVGSDFSRLGEGWTAQDLYLAKEGPGYEGEGGKGV